MYGFILQNRIKFSETTIRVEIFVMFCIFLFHFTHLNRKASLRDSQI